MSGCQRRRRRGCQGVKAAKRPKILGVRVSASPKARVSGGVSVAKGEGVRVSAMSIELTPSGVRVSGGGRDTHDPPQALPNAHLLFLLALIEKYTDYGICTLLRTLHREDPPATVHDLYKYRPQCTLCTCTRHVAMFCGSATPTRTAVAYCLL